LDPVDVTKLPDPSESVLGIFDSAGVSSEDETCSKIGNDILQNKNGTAVDAAIAVTFCLGVFSPQSSGIGGGLFMMVYSGNQTYALNARETAPSNINPDTYVKNPNATFSGGLSVGIPGEVAGLLEAHRRFGKVPWSELILPAQQLALNGFVVSQQLGSSMQKYKALLTADPVLASEFVNPATNDVWLSGQTMTRKRLGDTLADIGQQQDNFYNGHPPITIAEEIRNAGGVVTEADITGYKAEWVEPISYKFSNNLTMFTLPFPSSGPVIALALSILDGFGVAESTNMTNQQTGLDLHRLAEVLKFANAHRSQIADSNFVDLSNLLANCVSPDYATELRNKIADYKTYDDPSHYGVVFSQKEDSGTAQISVIGPNGDAVSLTTTINTGFGAGFMGNTTGIIYNNQIDDFSFPNATEVYGLEPNAMNFVQPGKRPASSMAPLIFLNDKNQPVFATGGSGGGRIVSAVISTTWRALYRRMDIKRANDYPRFMPHFEPAELQYEYGLPALFVEELRRRGHRTRRLNSTTSYIGNVNSVCRTKTASKILANADFRKHGGSAGF
jgi:gamma-glutamyltranspeptidase/glutathione hydrolase/leukotriene-C4 hydrolase